MAVELSEAKGSVAEAAAELGLDAGRISKWRRSFDKPDFREKVEGLTEEQKRIRQLERELREVKLDRMAEATRDIKKGGTHLFQGRTERFRFIKANQGIYPVAKMCKVLNETGPPGGVSSYYYWLKQPVGKRQQEHQELSLHIREVYEESKGCYGSPRITVELRAKGFRVSRPRIARVMRKIGLRSIVRKKYRIQTTDSNHIYQVSENHLNRDFSANGLGEKWVSDLTYIKTGEGWVYLTAILDLANRKVVGWALSETMKAEDTSVAAFKMALKCYPIKKPLLFHSDRGVQYACSEFRKQLAGLPITQSMTGPPGGRKGDCWDNSPAESFFKTLKTEMVYHQEFKSKKEAKLAIFEFIEVWRPPLRYNRKRRHSSLGYLSPQAFEEKLQNEQKAA